MSCPTPETWLRAQALELDEAALGPLRAHAQTCERCAVDGRLLEGLAAKPQVDARRIATNARRRIDAPRGGPRLQWLAVPAVALAAGLVLLVRGAGLQVEEPGLTARGGAASGWPARVAVELRPVTAPGNPVPDGATLPASTSWAVWYRNAESLRPLFLLAYVVDAKGELHWVAPAYLTAGIEPRPATLPVSSAPQLLAEALQPEAPAAGPATLVTVVSPAPGSVLAIEAQAALREAPERLLPGAVVWRRQIVLEAK